MQYKKHSILPYRPEIDGLRALAVIPVILFHAGFGLFSGGFVGVDVFFVISGYLITAILIEDIESKRFSILKFYERRARRILPMLFFVLAVCIPFAWIWMLPNELKNFSQSLIAVNLFVSNIYFGKKIGYFDANADNEPLLHTWSLAVEEQYYLLFPIFLILAWGFGKNRVFLMIVIMASISLLLSEYWLRNEGNVNFYLALSRAWELFIGSLAAFIVQKKGVQKNNLLAAFGLAAILFSIFVYDETVPFPSLYTLVPVLGTALLVLYADKTTFVAKFLSTKVLVSVGLISYSAYLWHQPLFAFAKIRFHQTSDMTLMVLSIMSILLAYFSWRYVETPFRGRKPMLGNKILLFTTSIIFFFAFIFIGVSGYVTDGYKFSDSNRIKFGELRERIKPNQGINKKCNVKFDLPSHCSTSDNPEVLLWGDSYAMHLYQGIVSSKPSVKIKQITSSSCAPILGISYLGPRGLPDWANKCIEFNDKAFEWLASSNSVKFVILSSPFAIGMGNSKLMDKDGLMYRPDNRKFVLNKFKQTLEKIKSLDVGVVVVSPTPKSINIKNIGDCLLKKYYFEYIINCDFKYSETSYRHDFLTKVSDFAPVYWLYKDICLKDLCSAEMEGNFIYRDTGHLSKEGSSFLGKKNDWHDKFEDMAIKYLNYSEW